MGLLAWISTRVAEHVVKASEPVVGEAIKQAGREGARKAARATESLGKRLAALEGQQQTTLAALEELRRLTQTTHQRLVDTAPLDKSRLDQAALVDHVTRAINDAPMQVHPFPHLVIPRLLPEPFYENLLRALPPPTFWRDGGFKRENWHIGEDAGTRLSESTWRFMHDDIAATVVTPALVARFGSQIEDYWRAAFDVDPKELTPTYSCDEGRLLLRRPGYKLGPHLDPANSVLTVLLYLAKPGAGASHGTDLYASDPLPRWRTGIFFPTEHGLKVERVGTVPFEPNTALAFLTGISVHGGELAQETEASYERITYRFQVRADKRTWRYLRSRAEAS